jgi:hypothetical protein
MRHEWLALISFRSIYIHSLPPKRVAMANFSRVSSPSNQPVEVNYRFTSAAQRKPRRGPLSVGLTHTRVVVIAYSLGKSKAPPRTT